AGLQLLIMDKLPFRHPSDPLVAGKMRQYELAGGNGFTDYLLPRAVTTFRQGFGRLIREETDAGLFVLGDQRLLSKAYGRRFLGALPRLEAVDSQAQAIQYLTNLSKKPG
ncbi:MAG: ATP-dependent DNA helicase, partial [Gammaproteobacteria bacterium]|nr:ATP-dependent DNA helicase [Gammaproteobacteria bacterium]